MYGINSFGSCVDEQSVPAEPAMGVPFHSTRSNMFLQATSSRTTPETPTRRLPSLPKNTREIEVMGMMGGDIYTFERRE